MANDNLSDDYQTVAERIKLFRDKHPEGSLRPADINHPFRLVTVGEKTYVVVTSAAYRYPEDPAPGVGQAWQVIPGEDEYSFGSEIMVAETSAFGRAIVASLAADTRKIASVDEVVRATATREAAAKKAAAKKTAAKTAGGEVQAAGPKAPDAAPAAAPPPPPAAASKQETPITPDPGPGTHDAMEDENNRKLIAATIEMLQNPESTAEEIRDIWHVLAQARLLAWRVEPFGGVQPDGDGMVAISTLVAALGRAKAGANS
jgi:hypothetical protein